MKTGAPGSVNSWRTWNTASPLLRAASIARAAFAVASCAYEGQIARRQVFVLQVHNDQAAVSRNAPVLPRHRAGIFTVLSSDEDCLLLEDNDRHLRVQLALRWDFSLNQDELIISTVVHVHNAFGRAYMVPVVPTHRLIMPLLLGRLGGQ